MQTIGVMGLGIIGSIWARHYQEAGVLGGTWNRTPKKDAPNPKFQPRDLASAVDVMQIVVSDPSAVRSIVERICPVLTADKLVIQSSTIDPESSIEFQDMVEETGAHYLEAPFTGSKPAAEERQTVFYLGGRDEEVQMAEPFLSQISSTRMRIGTPAQAATLKLAMNLNLAAQMQALAEALTLARRAGISDEIFFSGLAQNAGSSGLTRLKEPKLRAGDFTPQFSVKHMLKDLRLAGRISPDLPLLETVRDCLAATATAGHGEEDFSAVIRLLLNARPNRGR